MNCLNIEKYVTHMWCIDNLHNLYPFTISNMLLYSIKKLCKNLALLGYNCENIALRVGLLNKSL